MNPVFPTSKSTTSKFVTITSRKFHPNSHCSSKISGRRTDEGRVAVAEPKCSHSANQILKWLQLLQTKKSNQISLKLKTMGWWISRSLRSKISLQKKITSPFFVERPCFLCTDSCSSHCSRDQFLQAQKMGETICQVDWKIEPRINFQNDLTHQLMLLLLPKHVTNSWCVSRLTLEPIYINVLRFEFTFSNLWFLRVVTLDVPKKNQQKRLKNLMEFSTHELPPENWISARLHWASEPRLSNPIFICFNPFSFTFHHLGVKRTEKCSLHHNDVISLQEMNRKKGHMMKTYYVCWLNKVI